MTALRERASTPTRAESGPAGLLAILLIGQFMAVLDVSIVNVAVPRIGSDLHASGAGLQLVVSGYTITYAVLLVTGARLGDRFGHGRAFRYGLAGFTVLSLLCGLAPTTGTLIAARFLQGVGAALMMPQVMSLIQRTFAGAARNRALSLYAAVLAGGSVVGQVLGGVLVSADVLGTGWRPVFLVNVPIGLVLLVRARRVLPRDAGDRERRVDVPGCATLSAAVLLLVVPLVLGHQLGWPTWCVLALAASGVAVVAFVLVERAVEARGGAPIVSRRVLRTRGLPVGAVIVLLNMATYGGFLFTAAVHLQDGLGESAARAGLVFAPAALGFAATGLTWRHLPQRMQGPAIPVGLVVAAAGYFGVAWILSDGSRGGTALEITLAVVGLALGLAYSPVVGRALQHVPVADAADASGVLVTVIQLGQVIGVAAFGTLYLSIASGSSSAHAVSVTLAAVAVGVLLAAGLAARLVRSGPSD